MSEDYEIGDGPCQDGQDWAALLLFQARRNLTPPPPGSLGAHLDTPERQQVRAWVGHALLSAAHDGYCGCLEAHPAWEAEALRTGEPPVRGFGK